MPTESWWLLQYTCHLEISGGAENQIVWHMIFEQHHPLNLMFGLHDLWRPQLSQEVKCELRTWDNSERTWAVLKTHVWSIMVDYYTFNIYIYIWSYTLQYIRDIRWYISLNGFEWPRSLRSPLCWIVALRVTRFRWNLRCPALVVVGWGIYVGDFFASCLGVEVAKSSGIYNW